MNTLWLELGFDHILDLDGYDHTLYLVTLCAIYKWSEWRKVVLLATAFTIGHTITIALNVYEILSISKQLVEVLIPITIILTALYNLVVKENKRYQSAAYIIALCFGLIHGLGISNYLKALMSPSDSLGWSLLGFNIGVELAQLLIVLASMFISYVVLDLMKIKQRIWIQSISIFSILVCSYLLFNIYQ